MAPAPKTLSIVYFSDVLCVWAYITEAKIEELQAAFGADIRVERRFVASFGDVEAKIGDGWKEKGGWEGYSAHVQEIAGRFGHVETSPDVWRKVRPRSSHSPHLLLKAIELVEGQEAVEKASWALRLAFFAEARDIGVWDIQREVAKASGADVSAAELAVRDGRAFAALSADYQQAQASKVEGSPTFVFPQGRQKLYGDVGYRVIEANVRELLKAKDEGRPSWC